MDFGLTDDQRDIKRTARELLGERSRPERVRELAETGRTDEALWRELSDLGWLGIAGADADVIVLVYEDRTARALTPAECELVPIAPIDPTRSAARVSASLDAGEELADDVAGGVDRALVAISSELVGVCDRALE